jgi:MATE family multidrug resistance protein
MCFGENSIFSRKNIRYCYGVMADIAHIDKESKRLIQLGWPMTLSGLIDALFEAMSVAIVANYLGTQALTAYVVSALLIGLTDTFMAGPSDALNTVCAHAIGAENYTLAGQYVQIAAVLYLLMGVPLLGVWYVWMGDAMLLMGLSQKVATIGAQYTRVVVWHYLLSGLFDGYNALLDITGFVTIGAIFDIIYGFVNVSVLWLICVYWPGVNLVIISLVELAISILFFIIFTLLVICAGWLAPFAKGMLGTFALNVSITHLSFL